MDPRPPALNKYIEIGIDSFGELIGRYEIDPPFDSTLFEVTDRQLAILGTCLPLKFMYYNYLVRRIHL